MKFQDLSVYGLIAPCAFARTSGCLEGCDSEVFVLWDDSLMLFLLFAVTSVTPLKTSATQYCCSAIAEWPPALSNVQPVSLPLAVFPHMENASGGTPKAVAFASQTCTLMVVVMQNRSTHQTLLHFTSLLHRVVFLVT